jgi:hypothetical protein
MSTNTTPFLRLAIATAAVAALAVSLAACGSDTAPNQASSGGAPAKASVAKVSNAKVSEAAGDLLDQWTDELMPIMLTTRERSEAMQAGDRAKDSRLTLKIYRDLKPVVHWGGDARKAFFAVDRPTAVTRATTAAGDAWAKWALLLRTKEAIDFDTGAKIADQGLVAIKRTQKAYRVAGRDVPPALQTR